MTNGIDKKIPWPTIGTPMHYSVLGISAGRSMPPLIQLGYTMQVKYLALGIESVAFSLSTLST